MLRILRRLPAQLALMLLACAPALAWAQADATNTIPSGGVYEPSARFQQQVVPTIAVGKDSVTGKLCLVGIDATCVPSGSGGGGGGGSTPFTAIGQKTLAVSAASARVQLSTGPVAIIVNDGAVGAYFKLGDVTAVAATSDIYLGAGRAMVVAVSTNTYVAAITASGSTSLYITTGTGDAVISGGGGSGGGSGGAATIADGADVTQGAVADAAWSGSGNGTQIAIQKAIRNLVNTGNTSLASIDAGVGGASAAAAADTGASTSNGFLRYLRDVWFAITGTHGSVKALHTVMYDNSGNPVDWTAAIPVTDNGGSLTVDGTVSLGAGSATVGTVNLGTIGSAATAAKQPALGTAGTPSVDVITVQGNAAGTPIPVANTAAPVAKGDTTLTRVNVNIAGTTGDTTLVSATSSQTTRVHRMFCTVDAATNITLKSATNAISPVLHFPSSGGFINLGYSQYAHYVTNTNEALILNQSGTANINCQLDDVKN